MSKETKIAIPIFEKNKENILKSANSYIEKGADLLELRIDAINQPTSKLVKYIVEEINFPIIATNRVKTEGGSFKGSEEERISILKECCDVVEYIDIELNTDIKYIKQFEDFKTKKIISFHDFKKTPSIDTLLDIIKEEKKIGDIAKIAVMPEKLEDTIIVLAILSRCEDTIAISMGELGSYTRILASKFSSPITFASGDESTAPGQLDIETMKILMNKNSLDSKN